MTDVDNLLRALADARFPHAVAVRSGLDAELGAVLEVDAFDVAGVDVATTHEQLADVLWPHAFGDRTVLPGVLDVAESAAVRHVLPTDTVWYTPPPRSSSTTR